MIVRLRYVQKYRDRHGKMRCYLRMPGRKRVPLPEEKDPGFAAAHAAAVAAATPCKFSSTVPPGSLEALSRLYLAGAEFRNLGASTQAVYRRIIQDLSRKHGTKPVAQLHSDRIGKMMMERADTPAAANHLLRTLRALMKHAVKLRWRPDDPTQGVPRLREAGEGAETWTEADIAAYEVRWLIGTKPRLALALMLYTGQRRSDVVRMGRAQVQGGVIEVRQVKTGTRLHIPLHPDLAAILAVEPERPTFLQTEAGAAFTPNGFYMRFKGWCAEAGLPLDRSPHGTRKAAARRMAEGGCTAHQIAAVTGHKTLSEVQRYTAAADQQRMAQAAVQHLGRPGASSNPSSNR